MAAAGLVAPLLTALSTAAVTSQAPLPPGMVPIDQPPPITAEAYLLYDVDHDVMLISRNADEQRPMASVTKLITALVVLDLAELDEPVVISQAAADVGEAEIGLQAAEVWTVWELLNAIIVRSGNDAAIALAEHVGGSIAGFADLMNAKATELGMTNSHFVNPHGLDAEAHYSSANDLLVLTREALADPLVARLARTRVVKFRPSPDGDLRRVINTNLLLGAYDGVQGVKTGFTNNAGRVLIATALRDGRTVISVVLGSEDHFADTRELMEYAFGIAGPADYLRRGLGGEQGGGTAPLAAPWLAARLAVVDRIAQPPFAEDRPPTPLERRLIDQFGALIPTLIER